MAVLISDCLLILNRPNRITCINISSTFFLSFLSPLGLSHLYNISINMPAQTSTTKRPLPKQGYSPDLNKYVAKKLRIKLNGGREIEGIVIGVDVFMNVAMEKAFELIGNERKILYKVVVRGNSILMWELLEKVIS